jgi:hypothetical protein
MHRSVSASAWRFAVIPLALAFGLAACGGGASPPASGNGGSTASAAGAGAGGGAGQSTDTGAAGSPGGTTVTGSMVSSGLYDATWTWQPGNAADVGTGGVTVNSDKGTFGSISVLADGTITFTSGAPELKSGSYKGTGAQVHMKDVSGTQLPCGWTLDNDVTGSDGVIHLKGTMDVIGTVFDCPS